MKVSIWHGLVLAAFCGLALRMTFGAVLGEPRARPRVRTEVDAADRSPVRRLVPKPTAPIGVGREDPVEPSGAQDSSKWDDVARGFYEIYAAYGAETEFLKVFGPLPARPLALPWKEYRTVRNDPSPALLEKRTAARQRLADLNRRTLTSLALRPFEVFAYRVEGRLEVVVGPEDRSRVLPADRLLRSVLDAEKHKYGGEIPDAIVENASRRIEGWYATRRALERDAYRYFGKRLIQKHERGGHERNVAAVFVAGGKLVVVRGGEDPTLDRMLADHDTLWRETRDEVRRLLR